MIFPTAVVISSIDLTGSGLGLVGTLLQPVGDGLLVTVTVEGSGQGMKADPVNKKKKYVIIILALFKGTASGTNRIRSHGLFLSTRPEARVYKSNVTHRAIH